MIPVIILILLLIFAAMAAIRFLYDRNWSKGLGVRLSFADPEVREGEVTELLEEITNRKNLPLPAVEIDFNLDRGLRFVNTANSLVSDRLYRRDIFALSGNQKITRRLKLNCTKRGYYSLSGNGLVANDIFLSKKYVTAMLQNTSLYVLPEKISSERISVPFNRIMGELLTRDRVYEDPFEFGGIRDYIPTDPMKYINWKASAKSGGLVVNLHDSTLSQRVCILLDTAGNFSAFDSELTEEGIRIAASLAERITANGISLDIISSGRDVLSRETFHMENLSAGSMNSLLRSFARLELTEESIANEIKNIKPDGKTLYILISKNNSEENSRGLQSLAGANRCLWVCPYMNDDEPENPNKGKIELIPWAADVRKAGKEL